MQDIEKIFFSSDEHFGHQNSVARPPTKAWGTNTRHQFKSVDDMDDAMTDCWNLSVPKDGIVYVTGDFVYNGNGPKQIAWAMQKTKDVLSKLNGEKHLVVGNHDPTFSNPELLPEYLDCGFETVTHGSLTLALGKKTIELCHFPRWKGDAPKPSHYPEPVKDWDSANWLIHGHIHSQAPLQIAQKQIDVGVDAWSFRPVPATTILGMIAMVEDYRTTQEIGRHAPNAYTA